jgi:F0F1-type ATP synthase epsilon subunit
MSTVKLDIYTPSVEFFSGEIESLIVRTIDGDEGFLPGHSWANELLAENGIVRIREPGQKKFKTARTTGGYVEIRDHFVVFTENAEWIGG